MSEGPLVLTPTQYKIVMLLKNGARFAEIEKAMGYTMGSARGFVAQAIRANGAQSRDQFFAWLGERGAVAQDRRKAPTNSAVIEVSEFMGYRGKGWEIQEIADYIGCTRAALQYWIAKNNLQGTPMGEAA